jgi:F-type H+-transporting ATPase subunit b
LTAMQFDLWTLALQTVNFAILVWLLHRFLYKPVLAAIDARRNAIGKQYRDVDEAKAAVEAERAKVQQELEKIAGERNSTLKEAAAEAEKNAAQRRNRAETEAAQLMNETRKKLASEREEAMAAARKYALDLGIEIAERLLDEIPADLRAEAWLERIELHIGELGDKERKDIDESLKQSKTLTVVTAAALPQKAKTEWKKRIAKALGADCEIGFKADPALIAGAELHFETAILRYSWRSVLDVARSEVGSSENTD